MATEALKVDTQDSIEALQREAEELKKRLEEEKAKLKDVESMSCIYISRNYLNGRTDLDSQIYLFK